MAGNSLAFYDFSGGINTSTTDVMLGWGAKRLNWDDSYNVELYKNKGICRMAGNETFIAPDENSSAPLAICEYPKGTEGFVYVMSNGKIARYNSVLMETEIIYDLERNITRAEIIPYLDGVAIISKEAAGIYYNLNSSTPVQPINLKDNESRDIPANAGAVYAGRLWLSAGSTLYFSALGRFNDWTSEDDAGYISNFHSSISQISALAPYCGNLAIFKQDGVYLLSGNSPADFAVIKFADKGVSGAKNVCTCNNKQYFFNADGLFALSQVGELAQITMSSNIAHPVKEEFAKIDRSRIGSGFCVPYEKKNQIWFYLPYEANDTFNTILIYDFVHDCWTKRVEKQEITASANIFGEIISADAEGRILIENTGSTFDGKNIDFSFSTPFFHLGKPSERKIVEDFALLVDDKGENSFKFSVSKDFVKENKSDEEYIKTTQAGTLIWAGEEDNTQDSLWLYADWAKTYECALSVQIFDSNLSVQVHIESEKAGDDFKLVGIEFKEMINDF